MRLSEAIRLGAVAIPTIHGPVFKRNWCGDVCGACRAGATAMAAGYKPNRTGLNDWYAVDLFIEEQWPWTVHLKRHAPFTISAANGIALLHEVRRWSATQIADYIEHLEALYDSQPVTIDVTPNTAGDAVQLQEVS